MSYSTLIEIEKRGAFKVFATAKLTDSATPGIRGWYYPLYLSREEAITADVSAGGKGVYITHTFYEQRGEFYSPETGSYYGQPNEPAIYATYRGEGAQNPFSKIKYHLSELIPDQLPGFVRDEYDNFIVFLKAYYEFLEQDNKAQEVLENLHKYSDIDETAEELVEKFFKTYAYDISFSEISDSRLFLKNIRELYSKKGTETSYRILFSYLFKETIDFFYPYTVVLKASDGKWKTQVSLKVKKINEEQDIYDFKDTVVVGLTSDAKASVKNVLFFSRGPYEYFELELDEKSVDGDFLAGETITTFKSFAGIESSTNLLNIQAELYSVISRINVAFPSIGYEEGTEVTITDNFGNYGRARISGVDLYGGIKSIQVIDSGFDYSDQTHIDPGLPTRKIAGTYSLKEGKVTVNFPNKHGLSIGANVEVTYTGNIFSPVNDVTHSAVVVSIPTPRSIRFRYPGF